MLKDWLYDKVVRKNDRIRREYERYVRGHLGEHRKKRLKHWFVLLVLSWKYRDGRQDRIPSAALIKQKKDTARIRMEWIPGAVCYNIYVSLDGVRYRFLEKQEKRIYTVTGLAQETVLFFKYKVSMDGRNYSPFSEVLTISTVKNPELFFMEKLAQTGGSVRNGEGEGAGRAGDRQRGGEQTGQSGNTSGREGRLAGKSADDGSILLTWERIPGAVHYNLYRTSQEEGRRFLTRTEKGEYRDAEAKGGRRYEYSLKYTTDGRRYHDYPHTLSVTASYSRYRNANSGRLSEKGAESTVSNCTSPMHLAKGMMSYDVISFDVFDTLILRPFATPSDLFILVGERLDIMDFCEIRIHAEQEARRISELERGNKEVTLLDIYRLVEEETGVDAEKGAETEFAVECSLCYANPYMAEVFRMMKGQGKTIAAVSDMYLPEEKMRLLLARCGYDGFDSILVSCDYNCSKRNGGLYDILKQRYPQRIVHVGDNPVSDIEAAGKKGIDTRYYQNVNEAGAPFRAGDMSRLAGSAYRGIVNARLHSGRYHYSPYYEVGFVYTGFYVMGFCQWIWRYAEEHHLDKILFLAREGDIYQKVFQEMHPEMPSEYVLWSRIPVVKTIVGKNRHPYLLQIIHHKANALYKSKVGILFERTGIGELKKYFGDYRIRAEEYLTPDNERIVRRLVIEHWEEVCGCCRQDQDYIREYLLRKIGDARRAAVVDVGWSGNNVLQVKYLAEQEYQSGCEIHCLLAAARNVNDTYMAGMMQKQDVKTYIFSNMQNKGLHDAHQEENSRLNSFFFEILTQSSTPTFLGFDKEGRFLYDIPEAENYRHNSEIHRGALDFVREYQARFREYPYMLDISGHDAYMPFQYFSRNLSWLRRYFGGYIFGRDLFATQEKAVMESVSDVMKKAGLWEENV